ncbi:unnamed protein product [Acanthoscelides obtectus]|nr:unnamed protein product [Acanthoscelides obtectus]CAK1639704.1 hypothetical protein AOBTE_LOCUS11324 [Acanthoscelides obtectus]
MLKLYDEKCDLLEHGVINTQKKLWELVSKDMHKHDFYYSAQQCENKWKSLKRCYRLKQERLEKYGQCKRPCPFEDELQEIFKKRPHEAAYIPKTVDQAFIKMKQDIDGFMDTNLNDPPGFSNFEDDEDYVDSLDQPAAETVNQVIVQDNTQLVEELSELRKTISKHTRITTQLIRETMEIQERFAKYFEGAAQRETQRIDLEEVRVEQQNEIIKQMALQNSILQKLMDKLG